MSKISIENKIKSLKKQANKIKLQIFKEAQKAFKQMTKEIFKKYPDLKTFSWQQYTPYFNDGDTCTFSAYTDYIYINGSDESECAYEIGNFIDSIKNKKKTITKLEKEIKTGDKWTIESNKKRIEEINNANLEILTKKYEMLSDITEYLSIVGEDALQSMFGDHVSVIVSREGVITERYEHE